MHVVKALIIRSHLAPYSLSPADLRNDVMPDMLLTKLISVRDDTLVQIAWPLTGSDHPRSVPKLGQPMNLSKILKRCQYTTRIDGPTLICWPFDCGEVNGGD